MKTIFKYAGGIALAVLTSVTFTSTANAQRGFHGGGGAHASGGFSRGAGFRGIGFGFRGGFYNRFGYPGIGFRFGYLPYGYYPFYFGSDLYYYYGGIFYQPIDGGGYAIAVPPVGAQVPGLPKGSSSIVIDGQQYYEFNGVYYQGIVNDKGKTEYVIAGKDGVLNTNGNGDVDNGANEPQVGDIVNQLPDNCRKVKLNGKKFYVSPDGIYYEEFTDERNVKAYRIASIPADDEHEN